MRQRLPVAFLNVNLLNWCSKLSIVVRWNTMFSDTLRERSGVRPGGVLSPSLFYTNCRIIIIIQHLRIYVYVNVINSEHLII